MGRPYRKMLQFYDNECSDEYTYYDLVTKFKKIEEKVNEQGYKLCLLVLVKTWNKVYNTFKVIQFDEVLKQHCRGYSKVTAYFDGIEIIINEHYHDGVNIYRLKKIAYKYSNLEDKNIDRVNRHTKEITKEIKEIIGIDYIKQLSMFQFGNN